MDLVDVPVTGPPELHLDAPLPHIAAVSQAQASSLVDVPIQLKGQLNRRVPSQVLSQVFDGNLFDVTRLKKTFTIDVSVQLVQTFGVPSSSCIWGKRPLEEDDDILRAPLGTFNASASTSSRICKLRKSRSRRIRFTPLIPPRSPEIRAALRSFNVAFMRVVRVENRVDEPGHAPHRK
ncbi:hypothetical protein MKW92_053796 [Papaver armeniacum]|nr:hypothetical protein MKW92_053796 [Papaver armeniacum]